MCQSWFEFVSLESSTRKDFDPCQRNEKLPPAACVSFSRIQDDIEMNLKVNVDEITYGIFSGM